MGDRRSAEEVIAALGLAPHTEGGYFRETYRAPTTVATSRGRRSLVTAIHFLVHEGNPSRFHRLTWDEIWFFQDGGPLEMFFLDDPDTRPRFVTLDRENPQVVAPAGVWMAARVVAGHRWTLSGCVVTPGFEYEDFEKAERRILLRDHPEAAELIVALT